MQARFDQMRIELFYKLMKDKANPKLKFASMREAGVKNLLHF